MRSPRRTSPLFNAHEGYRVSHPVPGDASLDLVVSEPILDELSPRSLLREIGGVAFRPQRLRIDPEGEALRRCFGTVSHEHRRTAGGGESRPDAGETRTGAAHGAHAGRECRPPEARQSNQAGIGERSDSPLDPGRDRRRSRPFTQVASRRSFSRSKACRCIATRCSSDWLDRSISSRNMMTSPLSLDLVYSHSHFSTAFKQAYGRSPSAFRLAALSIVPFHPNGPASRSRDALATVSPRLDLKILEATVRALLRTFERNERRMS